MSEKKDEFKKLKDLCLYNMGNYVCVLPYGHKNDHNCNTHITDLFPKLKTQILDEFLNDLIEGLQADKDGEQPIEDALTYLKAIRKVINKKN